MPGLVPTLLTTSGLDVGVVTRDADAMRRWYTELLGFDEHTTTPMPNGASMTRIACGASTLKLLASAEPPPGHPGGIDAAVGYRLLTFVVPDLEEVGRRLEAAGGRSLRTRPYGDAGVVIAFANDPDGNLIELVAHPDAGTGLDAVGLTVSDADASRVFWCDVVGGDDRGTSPIGNGLVKRDVRIKGTTIKFWQHAEPPAPVTGPVNAAAGIRYLTARVGDVDAVFAQLTAAGAPAALPPRAFGTDVRIAFVADPDGNWLELAGPALPNAPTS